jgi:hypothetical protein
LTFNEQKFQKIERNQRFRDSESNIEQLFSDGKITDTDEKGNELKPHQKMELEERWFELSAKWKDKIRNQCSVTVAALNIITV